MGPFHWILLALFVAALAFLSMKSGTGVNPLMPAVKIPEAVRPSVKAQEAAPETPATGNEAETPAEGNEEIVPPATETAPAAEAQ